MTITGRIQYLTVFFAVLTLFTAILIPGESEDPGKLAYKVMTTADAHKKKGDVYQAGKIFLEAAMMYKKAIAAQPDNRGYKTNFKYCLGTRGYIQIKKGDRLLKEKKFGEAAKHFNWAVEAYTYALKELPGERNFKTNLEYAKYHGGTANFESLLARKGPAPGLKVEGFSGEKIDLENLRGKVVLVQFWTGWCPTCKKSMPVLENLYKSFSSQGLEIIAVAMDRDKTWKKYGSDKKALETSKQHSYKFGWGDADISTAWGNFNSVPTVILVDKKGNLVEKVPPDNRSEAALSQRIRALL